MPRAIVTYYEQPEILGWFIFLVIVGVMAIPYYSAFAYAQNVFASSPRATVARPLLVACAWTAAELGRGRLLTAHDSSIANPWALIGYTQASWPEAIQIASVAGVYGISFCLAAFSAGLAELAVDAFDRDRPRQERRRVRFGALLAFLPGLMSVSYGFVVLPEVESEVESKSGIRVAIVQGNVPAETRWKAEYYGSNLERYMRLSGSVLPDRPRLLLWPESAMTFFLEEEPAYQRSLASLLQSDDLVLFAGGPRVDVENEERHYFNSYFSVSAAGKPTDRTDKVVLVPFAETFPFASVDLSTRRFDSISAEIHSGDQSNLLESPLGPVAVAICNEAMFPEVVAERVARGAAWIVNPSNDTWIPDERFAEQQLDIVSLRAVEQRRWLVRVSTSGPSAAIDPFGRIVARTTMNRAVTLVVSITPQDETTPYAYWGDLPALLVTAITVAAVISIRTSRSFRPDQRSPDTKRQAPSAKSIVEPRLT